jgi:hypothetical protein
MLGSGHIVSFSIKKTTFSNTRKKRRGQCKSSKIINKAPVMGGGGVGKGGIVGKGSIMYGVQGYSVQSTAE